MTPTHTPQGPLAGLRVIEFAGIGPGPFACMLLSDMGADVVTIDRPTRQMGDRNNITGRGRSVVLADLKDAAAREEVLSLLEHADVLVEGFRPGVMERLGFGPDVVAARNPRLVYGRMTGWGQHGPLAHAAGHDLNYIAIAGALHAIGPAGGAPVPPLNLVGDYGGGALYLAFGILSAIFERSRSGQGQVVDAAMVDGASSLMSIFFGMAASGAWNTKERAANLLDGGSPFYDTYATSDSQWVSIGSLEPKFFAELVQRIGLDTSYLKRQYDRRCWPEMRADITRLIAAKTRDEWSALLEGTDVCFAPVLRIDEVAQHPHAVARGGYIDLNGITQPAPAPRFSRSQPNTPTPPVKAGTHTDSVLAEAGFSTDEIAALRAAGVAVGA
jgi:alpha-methylacyl-CoA racemase